MRDKISPINLDKLETSSSSEASEKVRLDTILENLGSFGRFQKIQFVLICIPMLFVSMHVMSWTFVVSSARKACDEVGNDTECIEWAYSASDRWDISGENSWIRAVVQAIYFIGQMIGSFACGVMADKIGRKKVLFLCLVIQVTSAVLMIFAPTWWIYAIVKIGTGFTHPGIFGVSIVLGVELVGAKWRSIISIVANFFVALGAVILAVLAYFILDYRLLHTAIAIPSLLFLTYWWIIRESARWLFLNGRIDEANSVLCATASANKKMLPKDWMKQVDIDTSTTTSSSSFGIVDLVRTPQIRKRTLANFLMWPVTTMVYYGLTMKSDASGGNVFFTFAMINFIEIPAQIIVFLLIDRVGRKILYSLSILAAGLLLMANWLTSDLLPKECAIVELFLAKACVSTAYTTMYTYTSELFPTVIRNTAVGCCSTVARFGAILASFIAFSLVEQYGRIVMILPFTILTIAASIISFVCLPETMGKRLPDSISEVEGNEI
ncbi:unnamed protein product [Caenorhabditis bovis]|uniref:Major facilitator superfamily (MFS) profile domain-containing protein n=1 Tax=Caenorhabditis bovis TaxID=2654633 RepID=A0A8S1ERV2_9PELO|nr:unnamed protein product [Caenorhabditis bovis]